MTSRERVACALARGSPDRLPVMEMAVDWRVVSGLGYRDLFDMVEGLDLDAVPADQVQYLLGLMRILRPLLATYRDEWGVRRRFTSELLPVPVGHPIRDERDLAACRPPDPRRNPILRAIAHAKRRAGDRAILATARCDFAASWYLCGMENLLESYIIRPGFALRLASLVSDYAVGLLGHMVAAGADVIVLTDDYAHKSGPLMSPAQFRRFVLPSLQRAVARVKELGAFCIKHSDGDIRQLLEPIVDTGVDAVGPLEPAAGMDLLSRGTAEEVRSSVRSLIRRVSGGGGHILSSGNTISSAVQPGNFRAMIEAAREPA
jgi:uroporphyrinogen decarboxylase